MMNKTIEVKVPGTDLVIKGDKDKVVDYLKSQGVDLTSNGEYYLSESLGLVRVDSMDPNHLRNAIRKEYKRWIDEMYTQNLSNMELATRLTDVPQNKLLMKMLSTLYKK